MRAAPFWAILLAVSVLAGCVSPDDADLSGDDERPLILEGVPDLMPEATLSEPPQWYRGEWWTYNTTVDLGVSFEATSIVTDATEEHWIVGIDPADPVDAVVLWHWPLVGPVDRDTLATDMHGALLPYLHFPVEDGQTWEVMFGTPATATATVLNETAVEVVVIGGVFPMRYIYDASVRNLALVEVPGLGTWRLVDHGFGYTGDVVVPQDLVFGFFEARAAGVVDASTPPKHPTGLPVELAPPTGTTTVPERTDGGLMLFAGNFALPAGTPGLYLQRATAPDGTEYVLQRTPAEGEGGSHSFHHVANPGGEWTFEHLAVGAGVVFAELYAYNRLDQTLEGGRLMAGD